MIKIGGQRVPTRTLLLIASDTLLVLLAVLLGVLLRFLDFDQALAYIRQHQSFGRFSVVVVVCCVVLYFYDLYQPEILDRRIELFVRTSQALGTACLILAMLYYFDPSRSLGRGIAILASPFIILFTLGWRLFVGSAGWMMTDPERVLVVGTGAAGISVVREILAHPELHLQVVGFLDEKGQNIGKSLVNPGIIGGVSDLESVVGERKIRRLILSLAERRGNTPVRELLQMKFAGIAVEDAHSFHERTTGRIPLEHLAPSWLILSEGFSKSTLMTYGKRVSDIVASSLALVLALPIMVVVALAILVESGWPIFFRQERTGLNGRSFEIMKFRSMYQNAEANGPVWASADDRRVTRVGKIIRKCRFDELPQLLNVLRGEMSLVGPRPERPVFCRMLEEQIPYYGLRHSVRPGITGWAQIKYQYGGSVEEAKTKLEFDLFYVKHISMLLDFAILFETAKVVIYGRGAK
jgi:sugar transferase (PEP-CTERM system associated)